jgi:hypothetical protein
MADIFPPSVQRPRLLELLKALDARASCLRRDECGDWAIFGRLGHIYAVPEGYQLLVTTDESPRRWTGVKKRLGFCRLSQDGDDEGSLFLNRLPTEFEAAIKREALCIPKARHLSEEQRSKLIAAGARGRFQGGFTGESGSPGISITPTGEPWIAGVLAKPESWLGQAGSTDRRGVECRAVERRTR